jgi:hypothetical protein
MFYNPRFDPGRPQNRCRRKANCKRDLRLRMPHRAARGEIDSLRERDLRITDMNGAIQFRMQGGNVGTTAVAAAILVSGATCVW